jgi:predicted SAM-dependent methyltransferase
MLQLVRALGKRVKKRRPPAALDREAIARAYLQGQGLEIGALHNPLQVPATAKVTYVDRLPLAELRRHYPELAALALVPVEVIDDGERLARFGDASQDFVIANHFLEHCRDPIGTLLNLFRVLKPGGVLYLAVPDKRFTFDRDRPVTPLEHLRHDHAVGPNGCQRHHFEEWTRLVNHVHDAEAAASEIERLMRMEYSIHYHVWTQSEFVEFLQAMRDRLSFEVELFLKQGIEMIVVLRKSL